VRNYGYVILLYYIILKCDIIFLLIQSLTIDNFNYCIILTIFHLYYIILFYYIKISKFYNYKVNQISIFLKD